jgi:AdoMet-dependent heme synthase
MALSRDAEHDEIRQWMSSPRPAAGAVSPEVPVAPFARLTTLWIQLTGTWCNLECTHCLNASGPHDPWLKPLASEVARRAIADGERLGVKEIYFTGGEPFLHGHVVPLLEASLAVAPTTVLTNGTLVTEAVADSLRAIADRSRYSLEIRVSLDAVEPALNDRVRGAGTWAKAVAAIRRLDARGLLPIVTATEILGDDLRPHRSAYQGFRDFLVSIGVRKPRVKIIPVFPAGRLQNGGGARLTDETLEGFDRSLLQCAEARVVAADGVYACPILAGLPGARLSAALEDSFRPARLFHQACVTCHRTGMTCRNS